VKGVVVDKTLFPFAICRSVPEIFAIEVESCQKSRRILHVFSPSHILGSLPSKSYTHFITPISRHVAWKRFCEDTSISPEVVVAHTLNFKANFKFSRLKFLGGPPSQLWCALATWSVCNACKNLREQHPQGLKYSLPKNVRLGGSIWANKRFLFVDQSSPNLFHPTWKGLWLIKYSSDFWCMDPFPIYSRSKSKVDRNRAEFWTFFSPSQILGAGLPKVIPILSPLPYGTSNWKSFVRILPLAPKFYLLIRWILSQILNVHD